MAKHYKCFDDDLHDEIKILSFQWNIYVLSFTSLP